MSEYAYPTADTANLTPQLNTLLGDSVAGAVLFSGDGLVLAYTDGIARDTAEKLSAAFSGLASLHTSVFLEFSGRGPEQMRMKYNIIDFTEMTVAVLSAGRNSGLAVAVEGDRSPRVQAAIGKALKLIKALGPYLEARDRQFTTGP
jgi:predicted regulator of Ras-like GTPase activity (Roadblock/LC7/MglB family)